MSPPCVRKFQSGRRKLWHCNQAEGGGLDFRSAASLKFAMRRGNMKARNRHNCRQWVQRLGNYWSNGGTGIMDIACNNGHATVNNLCGISETKFATFAAV